MTKNYSAVMPVRVYLTKDSAKLLNRLIDFLMWFSIIRIFLCYTFLNLTISVITLVLSAVSAFIGFCAVMCVIKKLGKRILTLWAFLILFIGLSYVTHFSGLEYILNTVTFLSVLTVLPYAEFNFSSVKIWAFLFFVFNVLVALFAAKFDDAETSLIKMNTNSSGFVMFLTQFILLAFASSTKKSDRFIYYILFAFTLVFQWLFSGRSSLIGTALLLLYVLFSKNFNRFKPKTVKFMVFALSALSLVFVYVYTIPLFNAVGRGNLFIFGKDIFTGRQTIWSDAFKQLDGRWLFGIGNTLASMSINGDTSGVTNLHNQMMGYLTCFGVFVAVAYMFIISALTAKISSVNRRKYCVALIITLVVMAYFDTVLYSTDNVVFVVFVVTVLFALDKHNSEKTLNGKNNYSEGFLK